jgi:large subunit ribosomal protein L21
MYAIIQSGGKQHRVAAGETLKLEKLKGEVGDTITFEDVRLIKSENGLQVGRPAVDGAKVQGKILNHGKGKKLRVNTYKRRKNISRRMGHRQQYTLVEITDIATA